MAHSALYKRIMNSREWIQLRNKKRQLNPLCECCLAEGKVEPMYAVHHIQEVESGRSVAECWSLALAESNLMSVCSECHRKLHEGSHTKEASRKRKEDRLAAWISQQEGGQS